MISDLANRVSGEQKNKGVKTPLFTQEIYR